MVYTATRAAVMVCGWLCVVVVWCCCVFVGGVVFLLLVVLCGCVWLFVLCGDLFLN